MLHTVPLNRWYSAGISCVPPAVGDISPPLPRFGVPCHAVYPPTPPSSPLSSVWTESIWGLSEVLHRVSGILCVRKRSVMCYFFAQSYFLYIKGSHYSLSVYFLLCVILPISGRSWTQKALNPLEIFPIYGNINMNLLSYSILHLEGSILKLSELSKIIL